MVIITVFKAAQITVLIVFYYHTNVALFTITFLDP